MKLLLVCVIDPVLHWHYFSFKGLPFNKNSKNASYLFTSILFPVLVIHFVFFCYDFLLCFFCYDFLLWFFMFCFCFLCFVLCFFMFCYDFCYDLCFHLLWFSFLSHVQSTISLSKTSFILLTCFWSLVFLSFLWFPYLCLHHSSVFACCLLYPLEPLAF